MKIALALRALDEPQGIGIYTRNIASALLRVDSRNDYVFLYATPAHMGSFGKPTNLTEVLIPIGNKPTWDQVTIARYCNRNAVDVLFSTKFSVPFLARAKTIWVLHATEWAVYPKHQPWWDVVYNHIFTPLYTAKAAAIFSVSEFTARDFQKHVRVSPEKVKVVYSAIDPRFGRVSDKAELERIRVKFRLPPRFILFVGKDYPGKNIPNIVRAYRRIREQMRGEVKLVAVGRYRSLEEWLKKYDAADIKKDLTFTGWIEQDDLPALYSQAECLLFPSFYESFGIPILEAMACGCPVVVSNGGACPEIAGGAAVLVDPLKPEQIADGVMSVLNDAALREKLVAAGFQQAKKFNWDDSARAMVRVFESLAS
jgi:glycosyltransferase involved in cell wall biosynthesis